MVILSQYCCGRNCSIVSRACQATNRSQEPSTVVCKRDSGSERVYRAIQSSRLGAQLREARRFLRFQRNTDSTPPALGREEREARREYGRLNIERKNEKDGGLPKDDAAISLT